MLVLVGSGVVYAQTAVSDPLPYSKGFLVTGNYVVGGVDLTPQSNPADANGFATGTVNISGVPADADIVGAFLYWEEVFTPLSGFRPADGVKFRGSLISPTAIKASSFPIANNPATCWGAAGTSSALVAEFRADVLYLLPKRFDANNTWTGKYLVNGSHTVTLPELSGNHAVQSAGATLVIVYRSLSEPLRKIVIYDGAYAQPEGATVTQRLRGFYQSSSVKSAQVTYIVGTGGNNQTEQISFNGAVVSTTDPFPQTSPSSDRSWANPTYVVSPLMPGTNFADGFGETANTAVSAKSKPVACRASAAVIFSTAVADVDADGIPDGLEDAASGVSDPPTLASPAGTPLPNLHAMGASSAHKDLFVEINAMWAPPGTSYGADGAPFSSSVTTLTDTAGHNHMPTPDVLQMVGDAYAAHGITPHFDVGDVTAYHAMGAAYACGVSGCPVDSYLVPSAYARGGEEIQERACSATDATAVNCEFPAFPGTIGWKIGLQLYRDAPVADSGAELSVAEINSTWKSGARRRRFDPIRADYFHYVLYAHARGKPKSNLPCVGPNGPTSFAANGTCAAPLSDNPDYHVPLSVSGVADLPGGNVLITLGLWDNFTGTPFVQASTTFHELGHNLNLWHGGVPAIFGDSSKGTATYIEPNCKPNYLSSMNYLFQVHGLFDDLGGLHLDYSNGAANDLDETFLPDAPLTNGHYVPAWFAPAGSPLAVNEGVSAATRFCNGAKFSTDPSLLPAPTARVTGSSSTAPIDWNGDGIPNAAALQNVNFDGTAAGVGILTTPLKGFDDWGNVRLDQIGAGRAEVKFSDGDFLDIGSGDFLDFGSGDFLDIGSGDFLDFGSGDFLDIGSGDFLDFGSGDFLDIGSGDFLDIGSGDFLDIGSGDFLDIGSGDFLDFGSGDFLDIGSGSESQEIDFDKARALGRAAPYGLTACVIGTAGCSSSAPLHRVQLQWNAPTFGHAGQYLVLRKRGDATSAQPYVQVGASPTTSFTDTEELPNGVTFTYAVKAQFDDGAAPQFSGLSNVATIIAIDDAPVANADGPYNTAFNTPLIVGSAIAAAPQGVLVNDSDDDSAQATLRAVLASVPSHGTVTLNPNGSFTYQPQSGFFGADSFTYKTNDGVWSRDSTTALSGNSSEATVSITVAPPPPAPVCRNDSSTVITGGSRTIGVVAADCSDPNGLTPLTVTSVTQGLHGVVTFTGTSITYAAASPYVGPDSFTFTVTNTAGGSVTATMTMKVIYGFVNVLDLPVPAGKSFNSGSTVPLEWQWTDASGVSLNSAAGDPTVLVTPVSVTGSLPAGWPGAFTVLHPGVGDTWGLPTAANGYTWQFNWKLTFVGTDGALHNLPTGVYLVQIMSNQTTQKDPATTNSDGTIGAEIVIK